EGEWHGGRPVRLRGRVDQVVEVLRSGRLAERAVEADHGPLRRAHVPRLAADRIEATIDMSGREIEVVLPAGVAAQDGRVRRDASIRKIRGHEEALLYNTALSPADLVTELLRGCLVRLGASTDITKALVEGLCSADRAYLLLEIRRATLGDRVDVTH